LKFKSIADKQAFLMEMNRLDLLSKVDEEYTPDKELLELFFDTNRSLFQGLKDHRKSKAAEGAWRQHRYKFMQGIKTFHRSTEGKRFHRELGNFLATHNFEKGFLFSKRESFHEKYSYLKPITSALTHFIIELEYYHPLSESVELHLMLEDVSLLVDRVKENFFSNKELDEQDYSFLIRLTETVAQVKAFAEKSGKSVEEVEKLWNEIKADLKEQGKKESDENFFALLVGILKKRLEVD
jgi:hypothetical protein